MPLVVRDRARAPIHRLVLGVCVLGALALGCATFDVRSDYDRSVDFSAYRSFAWLEPPVREPQDLPQDRSAQEVLLHNSLLDKRLRAAVDRALAARGLESTDGEAADLLLRYRVGVDEHTEVVGGTIGTGYYYGRYPYSVSPGLDT